MDLLQGKNAVVLGVISDKSIAWGVTQALSNHGAKVLMTYQNPDHQDRIEPLAKQVGAHVAVCNVENDDHLDRLPELVGHVFEKVDIIVHSLAFAPREALSGRYHEVTTREAFQKAHDVSTYSLVAVARTLKPLMSADCSMMAMSYLASQRPVPNYNVMANAKASLESVARSLALDLGQDGVRVNIISPGPIRTLAASAVRGAKEMIGKCADASPLRRPVTIEDVGNAAVFFGSDLSRNVTGQVLFVDAGYNIVGFAE